MKSILPIKKLLRLVEMTTGLVNATTSCENVETLDQENTLFHKDRIKSHISEVKQLPPPFPIFNVVARKFQHDLLL